MDEITRKVEKVAEKETLRDRVKKFRGETVDNQESEACRFDPSSRYYDAGGFEVQEIIRAKLTPEQYQGFCLGNIIKYSCRANFKGNFERDLEKVGFYQRFMCDGEKCDGEKSDGREDGE